jgi:hypothetical protein
MRKGKIFFLAAAVAATLISDPFAGRSFATGGGSVIVPLQAGSVNAEKGTEPGKRNLDKGKGGEGNRAEEKEGKKVDKPSLRKKHRLKYRDPYECGC